MLNTLNLDESSRWLTTTKSSYTLQHNNTEDSIFAYDFVRTPPNKFPAAHFHIYGESKRLKCVLNDANRTKDKPADFHLPVGGRRFRPCLEDIIEFCILEGLVTSRDNWQQALEESRSLYYKTQLKAAAQRAPEVIAAVLKNNGWTVLPPRVSANSA
ncbi:MAG: hypothetical protein OXI96_03600 [Acidimicrobiaceae bacterium]|nr:hypothetical protein [Acidimicrobiaceae bacterium]